MSGPEKKGKIVPYIRSMIRSDLPQVVDIEHESFAEPWCEEGFVNKCNEAGCLYYVAVIEDEQFKAAASTITSHVFYRCYDVEDRKKFAVIINNLLGLEDKQAIKPEQANNDIAFELAIEAGLQQSTYYQKNRFGYFKSNFERAADSLMKTKHPNNAPKIHNDLVLGYMLYDLGLDSIKLARFAVNPEFRKQGVGKALIDKLITKLSYDKRNKIVVEVPENDLSALVFSSKSGFDAIPTLSEDGLYHMELSYELYKRQANAKSRLNLLESITGVEWQLVKAKDDGTYEILAEMPSRQSLRNNEINFQTKESVKHPKACYHELMKLLGKDNQHAPSAIKAKKSAPITIPEDMVYEGYLERAIFPFIRDASPLFPVIQQQIDADATQRPKKREQG